MNILAIETSCDDTCVAIVEIRGKKNPKFNILANIVSSQVKIHTKWGGVYPTLAKREHQKNLPLVLKRVLKKAGNQKINLIAVTVGPGLEPCLWVGVNFAKDLAQNWDLPIIPINHIEAHIYANWLNPQLERAVGQADITLRKAETPVLGWRPTICLIVSGGHTQLILMKNHGDYKILGETRDDAAGECFDKVARILGLGYPGGPAIAAQAKAYRGPASVTLPRPMIYQKNYDFSFSGLKTAVLYHFRSQKPEIRKSKGYIRKMAAETQQAVIDVLIHKTLKVAKNYKVKTIILGGGVVANEELRKQFKQKLDATHHPFNFLVPPKNLCTDNAVMVAVTAYYHWLREKTKIQRLAAGHPEVRANANLRL